MGLLLELVLSTVMEWTRPKARWQYRKAKTSLEIKSLILKPDQLL